MISHAGDILALPVNTALEMANWLLYQVQKNMYEIYDNLRFDLVLGAYLFPEQRDLDKLPWGQALINTAFAHTTGRPADYYYENYPLRQEAHAFRGTTDHHLAYPVTAAELPAGMNLSGIMGAEAMPFPFYGANPEIFITHEHPYQPRIEALYDASGPYVSAAGIAFTHEIDQQTWQTPQFGSALSFSARLITQRLANLPDFNLDGDRGYGWKCWRMAEVRPTDNVDCPTCEPPVTAPKIETEPHDNINYLDSEGGPHAG
jgi:hypothetical protein